MGNPEVSANSKKRQRAPNQTTVTFSCSKALKEQIRTAAHAEHRSMSNWIAYRLEEAASRMSIPQPALRRVAEDTAPYAADNKSG